MDNIRSNNWNYYDERKFAFCIYNLIQWNFSKENHGNNETYSFFNKITCLFFGCLFNYQSAFLYY